MSTELPARGASDTAAHELFAGDRWPRRPWLGRLHREALTVLVAGAQAHEPVLLLTGDTGTGKSVIVGAVLDCIAAEGGVVASVSGRSDLAAIESVRPVMEAGRAAEATVVVAVDDAHELSPEAFKTVIALLPPPSGIKGVRRERVTLLLAGEFRLYSVLRAADSRLLGGIRTNVHLRSLSAQEVADYVGARLREASAVEQSFFTPGALHAVAEWSGGQPRAVNAVCASALREASRRRPMLTESTVIAECARALGWAPDEDEPEAARADVGRSDRRWEATKPWDVTARWATAARVVATDRWAATRRWVDTKRGLVTERWVATNLADTNLWAATKGLIPHARTLKVTSIVGAIAVLAVISVYAARRDYGSVPVVRLTIPAPSTSPHVMPPATPSAAAASPEAAAPAPRVEVPGTVPERPATVDAPVPEQPAAAAVTVPERPAAAAATIAERPAPPASLPGAGASPEAKKEKMAAGVIVTEPLPAAPILAAPATPRAKSTPAAEPRRGLSDTAAERRPASPDTAAVPSASPGTTANTAARTTASEPPRSVPKPASAPARSDSVRDAGEDSGAIIDWLLKEYVPQR